MTPTQDEWRRAIDGEDAPPCRNLVADVLDASTAKLVSREQFEAEKIAAAARRVATARALLRARVALRDILQDYEIDGVRPPPRIVELCEAMRSEALEVAKSDSARAAR